MDRVSFSEFRKEMADYLDRVKHRGERLVVHRRGRDAVAVVPLEDLAHLEASHPAPQDPLPAKRRRAPRKPPEEDLDLNTIRRELGL